MDRTPIGYFILVIVTFAIFAGSLFYCVNEGPDMTAVELLVCSALGSLGHILFSGAGGFIASGGIGCGDAA